MKILITGATGFIGHYVVKELLNFNHNIITTGRRKKNKIKRSWVEKTNFLHADLNVSNKNWKSYFENPDMVIHLSWEGLPNYKKLFHLEKNLPNNYTFLKNMIEAGCNNIVVIGTCLEYGMQEGSLREDLITKPDNPYALAKDTLRKYLEQLQKQVNFNLKWIRLFYMYGKGQSSNSILSQLEIALKKGDKFFNMSGGEQLRDYLPVETVAKNIIKISLQNKINGIINCCSGEPISIKNLVKNYLIENNKTIQLKLGHYPYVDYEPMEFWGDDAKLRKIIN